MKILFFDVDGVLNDHSRVINFYCGIHANKIQLLNRICEETNCDLIISSAWRYMVYGGAMTLTGLNYMFRTHGLAHDIIAMTPKDEAIHDREDQILWCVNQSKPKHWVAVDDLPLTLPPEHFVRTEGNVGLTEEHVTLICERLNDNYVFPV